MKLFSGFALVGEGEVGVVPGVVADEVPGLVDLLDQRALGGGVFAEQEKGGADVVLGEDFEELGGPLGVGAVVEGEGEFVGLARGDEGGAEELGGWPEGGVGVSAAGETAVSSSAMGLCIHNAAGRKLGLV